MGVFGCYTGKTRIPEEKKMLFSSYIDKILNYGGMMKFSTASLYGHKVALLEPVKILQGDCVYFHYNYFEDNGWETACYNDENQTLNTGKIGSFEFNNVIMAAYMLYEYFSEGHGVAKENDEIINTDWYTGWLNNLLGTEFSMEQRFHLWDIAEKYALSRLGYGSDDDIFPADKIWEIIPRGLEHAAGGTDLADLFFITGGTGCLESRDIIPGTYPDDVRRAKHLIGRYFKEVESDAAEDNLWGLLRSDREKRGTLHGSILSGIAEMSLILPARSFVYLAAEMRGLPFWKTWAELKDSVYHDEQMKVYAAPDLEAERKKIREKPVRPLPTSVFLRQDGDFAFWHTPKELEEKPEYYISDDDRMYWWDGSDEVVLSDEADGWLRGLAERHRQIIAGEKGDYTEDNFLEKFAGLLDDAEEHYQRIYAFETMFYDFIQNSHKKEYQAALELFAELVEENREEGEAIKYLGHYWDLTSSKVTFNSGRIRLKRYLSVMANRKLRKLYFGF